MGSTFLAKGRDAEGALDWALNIRFGPQVETTVQLNGAGIILTAGRVLNRGLWYHVAMVYDGFYLRGLSMGVQDGIY